MAGIFRRPAARRDLIEHYVYLSENAADEVADRFLASAEASFNELFEHPHVGAPLMLRRPGLMGLRKWRVTGFDKYLIFYMPHPKGISIVRVLHTARDWWSLLGVDE